MCCAQEISNRTHGPRTPKPEYLIAPATYLGVRWYIIRFHSMFDGLCVSCSLITFPETNSFAAENRPKRKQSYSNHPFSGANC